MAFKSADPITWNFAFSDEAKDNFKKLDKPVQLRIKKKIEQIMSGKINPTLFFKRLSGNASYLHSMRIGDYRLIATIDDNKWVIVTIHIGHRKDVYNF
ncbi:MAG: type II toxin-antitoxin system RelE/ParE family toxin [Proteobacteria bacterium]|nr:type II toxin-antitoxin system RelE/ParE family toxin [Pseudomonadota bacterium]